MINTDEYEELTIDDWYKMNHHDWKDVVNEHNDLLAEVKQLRGLLVKGSEDYTTSYMDLRRIIEDAHCELTWESNTPDSRILNALIALSEVIG